MPGEITLVWQDLFEWVWEPLSSDDASPTEFWQELFREMSRFLSPKIKFQLSGLGIDDLPEGPFTEREWLNSRGYVEPANSPDFARQVIFQIQGTYFLNESIALSFLEGFHDACFDLGGDDLSNRYFLLLEAFFVRFNLRYDLRRPLEICPTIAGLFANLVDQSRRATLGSNHLEKLRREFEEAYRDLRNGCTESRIKTCISKQYMFLEGLAYASSPKGGKTLGSQLNNADWPHPTLKSAGGNLYGFRSDYPGIGHGTSADGVLRDLDLRELVGLSCMVAGLIPYAMPALPLKDVYGSIASTWSEIKVQHNTASDSVFEP